MYYYRRKKKTSSKPQNDNSPEAIAAKEACLKALNSAKNDIIKENVKYVSEYVKNYDFSALEYPVVKEKSQKRPLEDIFYSEIKGNSKSKGINSTIASKAWMWKEHKNAYNGSQRFVLSRLKPVSEYKNLSRGGFDKIYHDFYASILSRIKEETREIFDNNIYYNKHFLEM
ncbi:MAG: hypothetical protein MJ107_07850, partial [Lachnospiraceae bacterium]|nr:hypothetical protein [Lachnospiraceae bacterium]